MTAKQKANQARFKKVVKEAAKLRKKFKSLTQAQAVKKAWAKLKGETVSGYSKERKTIHKRATKWAKHIQKRNPDKTKKELLAQAYTHAGYGPLTDAKVSGVKKKAVKKKTAKKKPANYHKDTKSHNVNIRVMSGIVKQLGKPGYKMISGYKRKSIGDLPSYRDPDAAREIELYADNDSQLYYQRRQPILVNLAKKYKKGTFDINKAAKLWRYYIDAALQKYNKEFGGRGDKWFDLMDTHDRQLLALEYAARTKEEFDLGNFPV